MTAKDTLGHAIANVMRRSIPEHTMTHIPESDKIFLQNVVHLIQDCMPEININMMEIDRSKDMYCVRLPMSVRTCAFSLDQLRQVQAYSPARICDISVVVGNDSATIAMKITSESRPLMYTEVDIIRISKRRCIA
jgi:hypothetical protein